jgi:type II secretory pathway component GspD/PulD (secretin)
LGDRSRVRIEVVDNDLMISSGDPQALRAVENTILDLIRQMPGRTSWTVFYLRVAEAQNAALQLTELIGESIYPSDDSGIVLTDQVDESLRIIPDQRTNALFVSGTDEQVGEVESFLEFIDATEVPGSFMNRQPHAIEVRYADVEEVADLLRNLYKDYLVDPVAERLRARRSGDDDRRRGEDERPSAAELNDSPGIRLTLAVDSKTGELLVACNDQLFEEIESVVRQRDLAVRNRNPITLIVPVSGPIADEVFKVLEGLSPRVTVQEISTETQSANNGSVERRIQSEDNNERTDRRPTR